MQTTHYAELQKSTVLNTKIVPIVETKIYMDDYLDSCPSKNESLQRSRELTCLLQKGEFKLTKFVENFPRARADWTTCRLKIVPTCLGSRMEPQTRHISGQQRNKKTRQGTNYATNDLELCCISFRPYWFDRTLHHKSKFDFERYMENERPDLGRTAANRKQTGVLQLERRPDTPKRYSDQKTVFRVWSKWSRTPRFWR